MCISVYIFMKYGEGHDNWGTSIDYLKGNE